MTLYIYSNDTGKQVGSTEGASNAECEAKAENAWGSNDYHWSYATGIVGDGPNDIPF